MLKDMLLILTWINLDSIRISQCLIMELPIIGKIYLQKFEMIWSVDNIPRLLK
jgi:hypothetical protein